MRPVLITCLLFWPVGAWAQLHALPSVDIDYQYDSNLFALPRSQETSLLQHGLSFADHDTEERAGLRLLYNLGIDTLYANVEARRFDYERVTTYDHNEFLAHQGLQWKIGNILDGDFDYEYERSMVPTLEFASTQLFIQHQHLATIEANVQLSESWRIESEYQLNHLDSPRPGFPSLSLTENSVLERVRYAPSALLSVGLDASYLKGNFDGSEYVVAPRYDEETASGSMKYVPSTLSTLSASFGYTHRSLADASNVGAATGALSYQRLLGSRTTLNVNVNRAINTYVTFLGTDVDTSAGLSLSWNASTKTAVTGGYRWDYTTYPDVAITAGAGERLDHYQLAHLSVNYQVLNWLALKFYGQYENRSSDLSIREFNRSYYGIGIELRLSGQADQPYELSLPTD